MFATDFGWHKAYPLHKRQEAEQALKLLHHEAGVPRELVTDNANEFIGENSAFRKTARIAGSYCRSVEAYTQRHNIAEASIREVKRLYKKLKRKSNSPKAVWDHLVQYAATILSHSAKRNLQTRGMVPETKLLGDTTDISHLSEFAWYQWVWYIPATEQPRQPTDRGAPERDPMENRGLGRYLGPSPTVGERMTGKILSSSGRVISRSSIFPLSAEDEANPTLEERKKEWIDSLRNVLKHRANPSSKEEDDLMFPIDDEDDLFDYYADDTVDEAEHAKPEAEEIDVNSLDKLLNAQVILSKGDDQVIGRVIGRKRDAQGQLIGHTNDSNPLLSTALYEVEFADGSIEPYTANIIAENIWSQVDDQGRDVLTFDAIIDHEMTEEAVPKEHGWYNDRTGRKRRVQTTKGWKLLLRYKDGTTQWHKLKDVKDDFMVQIAEYALTVGIADQPAFAWWVPYTIKKRDRILKAQATRHARITHKFGIEIPMNVKEALDLDRDNKNTFWQDAIKKEMGTVEKAFDVLPKGSKKPVGYQEIKCHLVFDVKMDFTRKARFVAEGFRTDPPASVIYSSVVSRESVRIAFLIAALNDLELLGADCEGAYLNAPCREKIFFEAGPEMGDREHQYVILVRALYGLKSSGASWRAMLAHTLKYELGFKSCRADPDVWYRPATKPDGEEYYEYILVYVDDILIISTQPRVWAEKIDAIHKFKKGSIAEPKIYLGGDVSKHTFEDEPDRPKWAYGSISYVKNALSNVRE